VPIMARLARQDAVDPTVRDWALAAIRNVARDDYDGEARALMRAALRAVRYTLDPPGHEYVQAPRRTLAIGAGDCDDIATLLAAAIMAIGRIFRLVVVARQPGNPIHVWAEMRSPEGWITIDPVTKPPRLGVDAGVDGQRRAWDDFGRGYPMQNTIGAYTEQDIAGFWASVWGGIKKVGKIVGPIAKVVGAIYPPAGAAIAAITAGASMIEKATGGGGGGGGKGRGAARAPVSAAAAAAGGRPTIVGPGGAAHVATAADVRAGAARPTQVRAAGGGRAPGARPPAPRTVGGRGAPGAARPTQVRPPPGAARMPTGARAMPRGAGLLPAGASPAPAAVQAFAAALQATQAQRLIGAAQQAAAVFGRSGLFGLGQFTPKRHSMPGAWRPEWRPGAWTYYEGMGAWDRRYLYPLHPSHAAARQSGGGGGTIGTRTMHGLGAVGPVRLVDAATEATIAASLPGQAALLAKTERAADGSTATVGDLRTRARRTNYGLAHIGEAGMSRSRAAERLMAWKKAKGEDVQSWVDENVRAWLMADGGINPGSVPTLAELDAKMPRPSAGAAAPSGGGDAAAAPGAQAPGAGPAPTASGAPAAPIQVSAGGGGAPTVPTQIIPPTTSKPGGFDSTTLALIAIVAIAAMKKRRA